MMNEFKDTIKKYREEKGITKSTLSKLIGVSPCFSKYSLVCEK